MARWSQVAYRHRKRLLLTGTLVSAAATVPAVLLPPARTAIYLALGTAFILIFGTSLVMANTLNRRRPRLLELRDGEFRTPRLGATALMALSVPPVAALLITVFALELAAGRSVLETSLAIPGLLVFLAFTIRTGWYGIGARLTAEHITVDRVGGSVTVAWNALDPDRPVEPGDNSYTLLLRPAGSAPVSLAFDRTDPDFLAEAITHYATEPAHRAAIGSPAELDRLHAALPPPDPATVDVLKPGMTRTGVVVHVVLLAAGLILSGAGEGTWWLSVPASGLAIYAALRLADRVRLGLWLRRRLGRAS